MQIFKIPKTFCKELNVLLNKFWWGGVDAKQYGLNWMSWDKVALQKKEGGLGFRDFNIFNLALLAKQAWRLLLNPEAKWVKILKAVYFPHTSPLNATKGKNSSWGWSSIHDGLQFLSPGLRWNIGNGKDVSIWSDKWIPSKPSFKVSTRFNPTVHCVSDLIHEVGGTWNIELIREIFDVDDANEIIKIPLASNDISDRLVWHHANNGMYNVKTGYHIATTEVDRIRPIGSSTQLHGSGMKWNSIWGLKCLPKVKHLIWKACHDVAPTNEAKKRRHHSRVSCCFRCGCPEETIEHVIFFCPHSQAIWRASCYSYTPSEIGFQSFAKWWLAMLDRENLSFDINLLASTIWGIWKIRNRMVFEKENGDPIKQWKEIERQYDEYTAATGVMQCRTQQQPLLQSHNAWLPPRPGEIKVNCDASFDKNSMLAGIVTVARNCDGVVMGGFNEQIACQNAFVAESLALRLGSLITRQHGWTQVVLESDCKVAVDMVNNKRETSWDAEVVIQDIRKNIMPTSMLVCYVKRSMSRLVDWLARATLRGTCPNNWVQVMPPDLYQFINNI